MRYSLKDWDESFWMFLQITECLFLKPARSPCKTCLPITPVFINEFPVFLFLFAILWMDTGKIYLQGAVVVFLDDLFCNKSLPSIKTAESLIVEIIGITVSFYTLNLIER